MDRPQNRNDQPLRPVVSFRMAVADAERLRNTAAALEVAQSEIIEDGIKELLAELQTKYNKGKAFPPRE